MSKDLSVSRLCDVYGRLLTENMYETVREYYDYDLSLAEIAEQHGVTRQAVLCRLRQAESKLRQFEAALGTVAVLDGLTERLESVVTATGDDGVRRELTEIIDELKEIGR